MVYTYQSSMDHASDLKTEHSPFKTASSSYNPRLCRQALASLDPNTPVKPSSTTDTKQLQTPWTKSPSNYKAEKHDQNVPSPVPINSHPNSKEMHNRNIASPVPISSPPALEKLQHDLRKRRRPLNESEEEEHFATRRANISRLRKYREKSRKLAKTISKSRREVEEGIHGVSRSTERI